MTSEQHNILQNTVKTLNNVEKSKLLSKFEAIKGFSSYSFEEEDWERFDNFILGYELAKLENNI